MEAENAKEHNDRCGSETAPNLFVGFRGLVTDIALRQIAVRIFDVKRQSCVCHHAPRRRLVQPRQIRHAYRDEHRSIQPNTRHADEGDQYQQNEQRQQTRGHAAGLFLFADLFNRFVRFLDNRRVMLLHEPAVRMAQRPPHIARHRVRALVALLRQFLQRFRHLFFHKYRRCANYWTKNVW